ncbi:DUF2207 domain-containing protein [Nocardiopsis aegyptia]|uniref:DUF2207 domain-containing protein n=1 Tax=Nocardiopsis aegyptia TaxID=220378 RepID=A0A7Z0JC02_9ACTN|nr:DUF2207 domain-containing protein [Nocardiopsis aegyptia]NYJ36015.1 hypothetical protein [Nocardiopsis aegyptia]
MAPASRSPKRGGRRDKLRAARRRREREPLRSAERRRESGTPRAAGRGGRRVGPRARGPAVIAGCVALLVPLGLGVYYAGERDSPPREWRVTGFDVQVTVHASGSVDMIESITYDFGDRPSHGLTRELPETGWIDGYGWRDFGLTGVRADSAEGLPVEVAPRDGDPDAESRTVVRVGDFGSDPSLTGEHTFEIGYTYERLTTPGTGGGARFYADVVGSGWRVPVESADVEIHLPDLAEAAEPAEVQDRTDAACYAGETGDRGGCDGFAWADPGADGPLLTAGHGRLSPGQAMSVRLSLPASVYSAAPSGPREGAARTDPRPGGASFLVVVVVLGCMGAMLFGLIRLDRYLSSRGVGAESDSRGGGGGGAGGGGAGGGGGGGAGGGGGGGGGG